MKLVRNKIPELFPEAGEFVRIEGEHLDRLLMGKVVEEVAEVFGASTAKEMTEEIADVIEVLLAFAAQVDVTAEDIAMARAAKRAERGGFEEGWILL